MKAKKFLKKIKAVCKYENCKQGKCPMAVKRSNGAGGYYTDCLLSMGDAPEDWHIGKMIRAVKKL